MRKTKEIRRRHPKVGETPTPDVVSEEQDQTAAEESAGALRVRSAVRGGVGNVGGNGKTYP
jgi:hypothetical protein